jgi:hypothetical protein
MRGFSNRASEPWRQRSFQPCLEILETRTQSGTILIGTGLNTAGLDLAPSVLEGTMAEPLPGSSQHDVRRGQELETAPSSGLSDHTISLEHYGLNGAPPRASEEQGEVEYVTMFFQVGFPGGSNRVPSLAREGSNYGGDGGEGFGGGSDGTSTDGKGDPAVR